MTSAQLEFFDAIGGGAAGPAPALAKGIPVGAERLLAALVRQGLAEENIRVAAMLALELDRGRPR